MNNLNISWVREQFPALHNAEPATQKIFFDGAGGTQVPQQVIHDMNDHLINRNAYPGGIFKTSIECNQIIDAARAAVADFLHAYDKNEIVFGQNMTTLTFQISRALAQQWQPNDEIIVTRLDHEANISPWLLAARDAGVKVRYVDINVDDCTLDMHSLAECLNPRTRLVAVTCASNAVGTISDIKKIIQMAHHVGALVYLDATHYAPHRLIDVQDWQCDFLVCSAHKFFGPHMGVLWGKSALLQELVPYKIQPAPEYIPDRWMTGSSNNEGIAGVLSAIHYLMRLTQPQESYNTSDRRTIIQQSMSAIENYEQQLAKKLLVSLTSYPHIKVWGITDAARLTERVPTIAISMKEFSAKQIAEHLAAQQIYVWHGHFYAMELATRLGLHDNGGLLRISCVHYNTADEIEYLVQVLEQMKN